MSCRRAARASPRSRSRPPAASAAAASAAAASAAAASIIAAGTSAISVTSSGAGIRDCLGDPTSMNGGRSVDSGETRRKLATARAGGRRCGRAAAVVPFTSSVGVNSVPLTAYRRRAAASHLRCASVSCDVGRQQISASKVALLPAGCGPGAVRPRRRRRTRHTRQRRKAKHANAAPPTMASSSIAQLHLRPPLVWSPAALGFCGGASGGGESGGGGGCCGGGGRGGWWGGRLGGAVGGEVRGRRSVTSRSEEAQTCGTPSVQ